MAHSTDRCAAMRRLAAAAAVALVFCACAVAAAGTHDRQSGEPGPALSELLRRNYSERSEGLWSCAYSGRRYSDAATAFQFDAPGLDLVQCVVAEEAAAPEFSERDVYFLLQSGAADSPAPYKCKVCDSAWYPVDRNPMLQRPLVECAVPDRLELEVGRHPARGGRRVDGVRCHPAYRKGCDRGYGWCHGMCCRSEALFYYPQLQKPVGSGTLLTAKSAGPREAPLLRLLMPATKSARRH